MRPLLALVLLLPMTATAADASSSMDDKFVSCTNVARLYVAASNAKLYGHTDAEARDMIAKRIEGQAETFGKDSQGAAKARLAKSIVSYTNVPENAQKSPAELGVDYTAECMGVVRHP